MYNGHILTKERDYMSSPYSNITVNVDGIQYDLADIQALHERNKILWNNVKTLTEENLKLREAYQELDKNYNELTDEYDQTREILFEKNEAINQAYQILEQMQTIS